MLVDPTAEGELLAGVVDASPDVVLITDVDDRIVLARARCLEVFGYRPPELLGLPLEALLPQMHDRLNLRGHGASDDLRSPGHDSRRAMVMAVRADGSRFPVTVALGSVSASGRSYTSVIVRDLSTSHRDEGRFRELLDAAPDATVIANARGQIVLTNRQVETVFGYRADELLGRPIETLIPERFRDAHQRLRNGYVDHPNVRGMGTGMSLFALRKDGTEFPVEVSLAPLQTDQGLLISAAIRDSTERLRIENSAARMREEFLATVSHELRSPLTAMIGYLELLGELSQDELGDRARRMVEVIGRNARRELRIVNDLLTLTQMQNYGLVVANEVVDLVAVAVAAVEDARVSAADSQVPINTHFEGPAVVLGDNQRLAQVIANLVTNAIKFTTTGQIDVTVRTAADVVELVVSDTGIGMAPDEVQHAFERHYRAPGAVQAQVPGAGLGLPITKAIVEAHHGQVRLESELGKGTQGHCPAPRRRCSAFEPNRVAAGSPFKVATLRDRGFRLWRGRQDVSRCRTAAGPASNAAAPSMPNTRPRIARGGRSGAKDSVGQSLLWHEIDPVAKGPALRRFDERRGAP